MSWFVKTIGERGAVKKGIDGDANLPQKVKELILSLLGDEEPKPPNGVRVEGFGHSYTGPGSFQSSIGRLEVEPFELTL
jgi:hypothetical protein